jgi:methionyl-tRNA synthetase
VEGRALLDGLRAHAETVAELYETREFGKALREVMALADRVERSTCDRHKPWEIARQAGQEAALHDVCRCASRPSACSTIYLKPVLPAPGRAGGAVPAGGPAGLGRRQARARPPRHRARTST